jgi:hypothetical protein
MTGASAERAKIVERARALLSMTIENGCTEAEAMTAAAKAAKLMQDYDLALGDIEDVQDTRVAQQSAPMQSMQNRRHMHSAGVWTAPAVADFFDCKCWRDHTEIIFFGSKDDVVLAHVMLNMIRVAMDRDLQSFMDGPGLEIDAHPATLKASFLRGMGQRVSERFDILKHERTAMARSRGNELVVMKGALVDTEFAKLFPNGLGKASRQKPTNNEWAYAHGADAADSLNLFAEEVSHDQSRAARVQAKATKAKQAALRLLHWRDRLADARFKLKTWLADVSWRIRSRW